MAAEQEEREQEVVNVHTLVHLTTSTTMNNNKIMLLPPPKQDMRTYHMLKEEVKLDFARPR